MSERYDGLRSMIYKSCFDAVLKTHCCRFIGRQHYCRRDILFIATSQKNLLSQLNSDSSQSPEMKVNIFVFAVALLGAFQPRYECRAIENPLAVHPSHNLQAELQQQLPILLRLGKEYFIRLDNSNQNLLQSSSPNTSPGAAAPSTTVNRALQLQLTQHLLQGKVGDIDRFLNSYANQMGDSMERGKRSGPGEEPPISLDLTFHLLREVLEMARAEQLAQQANSNRKMMDIFGK
uniref:Corticotropin releasing hormone n=1 Tax=Hucho hucho TaxID=62062 RepID=A0A4W5PCS2_9TELE